MLPLLTDWLWAEDMILLLQEEKTVLGEQNARSRWNSWSRAQDDKLIQPKYLNQGPEKQIQLRQLQQRLHCSAI